MLQQLSLCVRLRWRQPLAGAPRLRPGAGAALSTAAAGALQPSSPSLLRRVRLFEEEKQRQAAVAAAAPPPSGEVLVECPELPAPLTRAPGWAPIEALKHVPKGDDDRPVVAVRVNGRLQGLYDRITQPGRVALELVRFGEPDGTRVFWHSAAHVTGAALEAFFGDRVQLCDGPPLSDAEGGFFYEMHLLDDAAAAAASAESAAGAAGGATAPDAPPPSPRASPAWPPPPRGRRRRGGRRPLPAGSNSSRRQPQRARTAGRPRRVLLLHQRWWW